MAVMAPHSKWRHRDTRSHPQASKTKKNLGNLRSWPGNGGNTGNTIHIPPLSEKLLSILEWWWTETSHETTEPRFLILFCPIACFTQNHLDLSLFGLPSNGPPNPAIYNHMKIAILLVNPSFFWANSNPWFIASILTFDSYSCPFWLLKFPASRQTQRS